MCLLQALSLPLLWTAKWLLNWQANFITTFQFFFSFFNTVCSWFCCKEYLSFYFFARLNLICRHSKRNRIMAHQPAFRLLAVFFTTFLFFSYESHEWFGLKLQSQVLRFPKVVKKILCIYCIQSFVKYYSLKM